MNSELIKIRDRDKAKAHVVCIEIEDNNAIGFYYCYLYTKRFYDTIVAFNELTHYPYRVPASKWQSSDTPHQLVQRGEQRAFFYSVPFFSVTPITAAIFDRERRSERLRDASPSFL